MTNLAIAAHGLSHSQGDFDLRGIDFELPTGLVMGFVGPNGSGKTTTIRALLGMFRPNSGSIGLLGGRTAGSTAAKQRTGVILDLPFVSPDWAVSSLAFRVGRFFSDWDDAYFTELLAQFGIDNTGTVGELSRGEGVKLSLAMALAHRPELLILDEPTSGLDPVSRADLIDILRDFMVDETHSILFSTHITSDLDSLADLILVIDDGRIEYSGTLEGLRDEFAMVHGTEPLSAEAERSILGLTRSGTRFDGLIRAESTPLFGPTTVVDTATTDDVVVHLARRTTARKDTSAR